MIEGSSLGNGENGRERKNSRKCISGFKTENPKKGIERHRVFVQSQKSFASMFLLIINVHFLAA